MKSYANISGLPLSDSKFIRQRIQELKEKVSVNKSHTKGICSALTLHTLPLKTLSVIAYCVIRIKYIHNTLLHIQEVLCAYGLQLHINLSKCVLLIYDVLCKGEIPPQFRQYIQFKANHPEFVPYLFVLSPFPYPCLITHLKNFSKIYYFIKLSRIGEELSLECCLKPSENCVPKNLER